MVAVDGAEADPGQDLESDIAGASVTRRWRRFGPARSTPAPTPSWPADAVVLEGERGRTNGEREPLAPGAGADGVSGDPRRGGEPGRRGASCRRYEVVLDRFIRVRHRSRTRSLYRCKHLSDMLAYLGVLRP